MKYLDFSKNLSNYPLFTTDDLKTLFPKEYNKSLVNNLRRWSANGFVTKLRKNLYLLRNFDYLDPAVLATRIYSPSYISTEYALAYYGIIPEMVFSITSVTTKLTKEFHNDLGHYYYQKIKTAAFGGYIPMTTNNISFYLATPEKALVDFFYLKRDNLAGDKVEFESYRFDEEYRWKKGKLIEYAKLFGNKKTLFLTKQFIKYYATKF